MRIDSVCRLLDWDSEFFGFRIAQVTAGRLSPAGVKGILEWCGVQAVRCLYFLADADDPSTVMLAEDHGFRLVDLRVTLEYLREPAVPVKTAEAGPSVRRAVDGDIPALRAIAGRSHADSRFHFDPGFPRRRCEEFYGLWIEKSCRGYADLVLVAESGGRPGGYISCHREESGNGRIGLMAVGQEFQGRGNGRGLVREAQAWFAARGVGAVTVVTQGRNIQAQRLYQECGFRTRSVQLWYHRWFPSTDVRP